MKEMKLWSVSLVVPNNFRNNLRERFEATTLVVVASALEDEAPIWRRLGTALLCFLKNKF